MRKFICGCDLPSEEQMKTDPLLKSVETCTFDAEGFLICVIHHERRYGWRSLPVIAVAVKDGGETEILHRPDFSKAHLTPLQVEREILFGIVEPPSDFGLVGPLKTNVEDRRDNRDPHQVGRDHFMSR